MDGERLVPHAAQVVNRLGQGRDDTTYLRMPGIGGKSNFHRLNQSGWALINRLLLWLKMRP